MGGGKGWWRKPRMTEIKGDQAKQSLKVYARLSRLALRCRMVRRNAILYFHVPNT